MNCGAAGSPGTAVRLDTSVEIVEFCAAKPCRLLATARNWRHTAFTYTSKVK